MEFKEFIIDGGVLLFSLFSFFFVSIDVRDDKDDDEEDDDAQQQRMVVVQTKAGGGGTSLVPVSDRVVAFLPYLLPLISGLRYSRYFFAAFPAAIIMLQPLLPIVKIVATLPLGNLIPFLPAYLGVAGTKT